jgi:hypothetical protein
MKRVLVVVLSMATLVACKSSDKKAVDPSGNKDTAKNYITPTPTADATPPADATTIQWLDSTFIDLGKRPGGKEIDVVFRFKNTGDKPLVITEVRASCGCTTPKRPEKAFAPGEKGEIKATFNGIGSGIVSKDVHVTANTSPTTNHTLTFRTELINK